MNVSIQVGEILSRAFGLASRNGDAVVGPHHAVLAAAQTLPGPVAILIQTFETEWLETYASEPRLDPLQPSIELVRSMAAAETHAEAASHEYMRVRDLLDGLASINFDDVSEKATMLNQGHSTGPEDEDPDHSARLLGF